MVWDRRRMQAQSNKHIAVRNFRVKTHPRFQLMVEPMNFAAESHLRAGGGSGAIRFIYSVKRLRGYAVCEHVLFHGAGAPRIGPGEAEGSGGIHRASRIVAVLVAVGSGNGFIRLCGCDLQVLPGGAAIGGKRDEAVSLLAGAVSPRIVERHPHSTTRGDRDLRVEVVGMIRIVVDFDFSRPGNAAIIGGADVGVGVIASWVLVKIGGIQPAGVSAGLVDRRHWKGQNPAALLRWDGNEERSRVDAEIGNDVRRSESGAAIG